MPAKVSDYRTVSVELDGGILVFFRMEPEDKDAKGAMVSFDQGKTWVKGKHVSEALSSFQERFPFAFQEGT